MGRPARACPRAHTYRIVTHCGGNTSATHTHTHSPTTQDTTGETGQPSCNSLAVCLCLNPGARQHLQCQTTAPDCRGQRRVQKRGCSLWCPHFSSKGSWLQFMLCTVPTPTIQPHILPEHTLPVSISHQFPQIQTLCRAGGPESAHTGRVADRASGSSTGTSASLSPCRGCKPSMWTYATAW